MSDRTIIDQSSKNMNELYLKKKEVKINEGKK